MTKLTDFREQGGTNQDISFSHAWLFSLIL